MTQQEKINNALNALKEVYCQNIGLDDDHIVVPKKDMLKIQGALTVALETVDNQISELTGTKAVLEKALKVVNKIEI